MPRWLRLQAAPMFSIEGQMLGHVAGLEEVTDHRRAKERLVESETQLTAAAGRQKQIEETLSRLREDLERQLQTHAERQRQAEEKLHHLEASKRQTEEALQGSRNDFARLMDEHTAARRQAEEERQRERDDLARQFEEHATARRQAEEALRRQREEYAPRMEEGTAAQRKAEETLQAVRLNYEKQLEKLTNDSLNEMASLEEKLSQARQSEPAVRQEVETLRQQLSVSQSRQGDLEVECERSRQSVEALTRDKAVLEMLMHHAPDGVCAFDHDGRYTFWNSTMERLTGIARAAALGRSTAEVFAVSPNDEEVQRIHEVLEGKPGVIRLRVPAAFGAGVPTWLDKSYAPLHDPDGAIVGGVAIVRPAAPPPSQVEPPATPILERAPETNGASTPLAHAVAEHVPLQSGDWLSYN
jgi:PAS domain S-box-containing protein